MVNLLSSQLAEHKLHVAETYTKAGLRELRDLVMTAVRDLRGPAVRACASGTFEAGKPTACSS
ncbi:MAG: hypothetical protein EOS19_30315 [Mesorhizobium sp.]|nr:MAG: hypothetical protein EOS19_30315 [Mesorhizobium sp.]